jgi:GNAT superfamily N-acetyltransferase
MSVKIRRALEGEVAAVARLYRRTAGQAWDFLVPHTPEEDLGHFGLAFRQGPIWLAVRGDEVIGFCAVCRGWIDHFYVAPEEQGRGAGQRLIARALKGRSRVRLWTFQRNARSRRFYELQGFREVLLTDGQANEEKEPDVLLEWLRPAPS